MEHEFSEKDRSLLVHTLFQIQSFASKLSADVKRNKSELDAKMLVHVLHNMIQLEEYIKPIMKEEELSVYNISSIILSAMLEELDPILKRILSVEEWKIKLSKQYSQ